MQVTHDYMSCPAISSASCLVAASRHIHTCRPSHPGVLACDDYGALLASANETFGSSTEQMHFIITTCRLWAPWAGQMLGWRCRPLWRLPWLPS